MILRTSRQLPPISRKPHASESPSAKGSLLLASLLLLSPSLLELKSQGFSKGHGTDEPKKAVYTTNLI